MSAIDRRHALFAASALAGLAVGPTLAQAQAPAAAPAGGGELARIRQRGTLRVGAAVFSPVYIKPPTGDWQGVAPDVVMRVFGVQGISSSASLRTSCSRSGKEPWASPACENCAAGLAARARKPTFNKSPPHSSGGK